MRHNGYGGVDTGVRTIENCNTTTNFAWFIANFKEQFLSATNQQLFSLTLTPADNDVYYYTASCMWHSQPNTQGSSGRIENIIDIEVPGKITVYKKGQTGKVEIDLNNFEKAKSIYQSIYGKSAEFTEEQQQEMIKNLSVFTYAVQTYAHDEGPYYDKWDNEGSGLNSAEAVAKYYWWKKDVQKYVVASGIINDWFKNVNENSISGTEAPMTKKKIEYLAEHMFLGNPILEKVETTPSIEYKGGKAYIGPFKVESANGIPNVTVGGNKVKVFTKNSTNGAYEEFKLAKSCDEIWNIEKNEELNELDKLNPVKSLSEKEFYIELDEQTAKELKNIEVVFTLNYSSLKSKLALCVNENGQQQQIMFHIGKETPGTMQVSWAIEESKELTIQKTDENGNALNIPGIKFEIYDSKGVLKYTLATSSDGETTPCKINKNEEYTIKEITNNAYGYKGCNITDAVITSGAGTISKKSGEVKLKITEDSTIAIKNTPELGNVVINKKGEDDTGLGDVEFVLWQGNKYIQLKDYNGNIVSNIKEEVTINKNNIATTTEYRRVYVDDIKSATKFKTNDSGKIIINNLEVNLNSTEKFEYWLIETTNNNYGYNSMKITEENVSAVGGTIKEVNSEQRKINFTINENIEITLKNNKELGHLEIQKNGQDGAILENVEFIIGIGENKYLQLIDAENKAVTSLKGIARINSNNIANSNEYSVNYVDSESDATKFITNYLGKIVIKNLEIDESINKKYEYTAREINNPNYGYGSRDNAAFEKTVSELKVNEFNEIKMENIQNLGDLKLTKYDKDNNDILLSDVGFVINVSPSLEKQHAYIALYNKNGKLVQNVKGTIKISSENIATENEYKLGYYYSDKTYVELTDEEKANITTFITGKDGTLTLNNLEIYSQKTGETYTYKLIETSNANYGYDIDSVELGNIILETDKTIEVELGNTSKYTKISGYVWKENPAGKASEYDGVYTEGTDIKLTDLYIVKNGKLVKNPDAKAKVEIKLCDRETEKIIKELPDEFNSETGKYTFLDVEISNLNKYKVIFVYDGFYYTTVVEQIDKENGSKVKESVVARSELSNKFITVKQNGKLEGVDEVGKATEGTIVYNKDGHISTVSKINGIDTNVEATTAQASYYLHKELDKLKENSNTNPVIELENVNMGIVLREQPKISINNDIYSAQVEFEGYKYNYKYNGRQNYYVNKNDDSIGVKFEQENATKRYTRTVYASDIQAAVEQEKQIKVSITYKIQIANESKTLNVMPKQIVNYFDARYNIQAVGFGIDKKTNLATNELTEKCSNPEEISIPESDDENAEYVKYKSTIIDVNQMIKSINSGENVQEIYITFDVQRDAIIDLLSGKSTYHNACEILNYASYYGEDTSKADGKQIITDTTKAGLIYAGIDKMSEPGNMELKLIDYKDKDGNVDGTKILDTTNYEDDTASAPSLILEAVEERKLSGTIWEDSITNTENNQKLGDGIYKDGEKAVKGVTVTLHKLGEDGSIEEVAIYSDGKTKVVTETDENGQYTFGYYDEKNKKHIGILPGKYVIKYTYNNEDYIVGHKNINVNDYKSTIITSQIIKKAFGDEAQKTNEKWYLIQENERYSDARDDINLRPEYDENNENTSITNATYNKLLKVEDMHAYTPKMDIGIEFTESDEIDALIVEPLKEAKNIDFGLVERPNINITIEKQITGLEIIAQNGTVIVPKGNPSNPGEKMQYVKTGLDGVVPAEIEPELLQGAQLNLEYTIAVTNNSDRDYLEKSYYYYGTGGKTETTTQVKKVVDYLESTMVIDVEKTQASGSVWKKTNAEDLYKGGYINKEVYDKLKGEGYNVYVTNDFEDLNPNEEKEAKLYTTKYLAISDIIVEGNSVEIIELTGKRVAKESIPGNNPPSDPPEELDGDIVDLIITPPTGTTVNYNTYIITILISFIILLSGAVIIKKKLIK